MSTGGPDLFVICKSCGSEVSPYITECPYCGNRLRKRAPKLDREGKIAERRRRLRASPSLPRLRKGEIPGIRAEANPYATIALIVAGLAGTLLWRILTNPLQLIVFGKPWSHAWRLVTASFLYNNTGYAFITLGAIALYGWLLERRHGPIPVVLLYALGGIGGIAVASVVSLAPILMGANGGALALLCAWAVPDLLELRAGAEIEGDLIGTGFLAVVIALMPLVAPQASWVADGVGVLAGFAVGLALATIRR